MPSTLILNELSCVQTANKYLAAARMTQLISTIVGVRRIGGRCPFRTVAEFNDLELAPGYPVSRWRNDPEVPRDERTYLRNLEASWPLLEPESEHAEIAERCEITFESKIAHGMLAALLTDGLILSFESEQRWNVDWLSADFKQMNQSAEIITTPVRVRHGSNLTHIATHESWLIEQNQLNFLSGEDLWRRREALTCLEFCENVAEYIEPLSGGDPKFRQVVNKLCRLNSYTWSSGAFDPKTLGFKISNESETTLQQFSQERTFRIPDGSLQLFELHARLTPEPWRIHLLPIPKRNKILIGYIGPHLPVSGD